MPRDEEEYEEDSYGEDDDIYDEGEREKELEEEIITPEEAGFVEGYEFRDLMKCDACGAPIDPEDAVERVIKGQPKYFCSEECAVQAEEEAEEKAA